MKNLSVSTFIHLLFSLAIGILVATIFFFLSWNKERHKLDEINHYKLIADAFLSNVQLNPSEEQLEQFYNDFSVKPVPMERAKKEIEDQGKTIFAGQSMFGMVRVFQTPKGHYIYVQRLGYNLMLQDDRPPNYTFEIALGIGIFLVLLLFLLYFAILLKLYPLRRLHKKIQQFANGDTNIKLSYPYEDEIGKIARSFDEAIVHINQLIASKNLFMRNIMHELKTPITKGRIAVEAIDDEVTKNILIRAFERMNELISELAQVERVTTQNFTPFLQETTLQEVLKKAQDLLMVERSKVELTKYDINLRADVKLLALAIKNLLDNGIKYSKNKKVSLQFEDGVLRVSSLGEPLKHPLSFYTEPFSQEEKRSSGFGLGLYIVDNILQKMNLTLKYEYANGKNHFDIDIRAIIYEELQR
ncbi:MAG TPA: HAMP domain-containing histidine kinase [Epsilonproteobacteria bacterium]|nr:HAMP domain-containing histidine kinase [Campylobacterota bacterium]